MNTTTLDSPKPSPLAAASPVVSSAAPSKTLPIIYGWLGENWTKGLGRGRLMWSLADLFPVILLEKDSPGTSSEPFIDQVAPNRFIMRNAMRRRYSRIGRRVKPLSAWLDGRQFHRALRRAGFDDYIYWLTVNDPGMLLAMSSNRLIYDCIDPCFFPERQAEFDRTEAAVVKKARMVFCTANSLHQRMRSLHSHAFLLPNACHVDTYHACQSPQTLLPAALADRKRPFIGYMGTIDWRFDAATVTQAARRMPDCTFVIVGRVNQDQESNVRELRSLPNVLITGAAGYDEGHAYTKAFDVGIIPFTPGPMNDAINSVKMYMYLAAGKPIVSTWLAESIRAQPLVHPTKDASEFVEALRAELAADSPAGRQSRIAFALDNTWDHRTRQATTIMRAQGILPN